jgi:hypothetical protein
MHKHLIKGDSVFTVLLDNPFEQKLLLEDACNSYPDLYLACSALKFMKDLFTYEGAGRTVEKLYDSGEQMLHDDK